MSMSRIRKFDVIFKIAIIVAVWELIFVAATKWFGWSKTYTIPSPEGVTKSIEKLLYDGTLVSAVICSLKRVFLGLIISLLGGSLLGAGIVRYKFLERTLKPIILGIQTLPSICWVPFSILWFGLKESAIIFVVVMGSMFSVTLSLENSIRNVPPIYISAARTMGVSGWMLYRKVIIPAAIPMIISGLKQAWSFAWRALMSGEMMFSSVGLGYSLMLGRSLADINQVMAIMILIILIGVFIDRFFFAVIEKRILKKRGLDCNEK